MGQRTTLRASDREFLVEIDDAGGVDVDGNRFRMSAWPDGSLQIERVATPASHLAVPAANRTFELRNANDGSLAAASSHRAWAVADGDTRWVFLDGRTYRFEGPREERRRRRGGTHHGSLTAPMPATVRRIEVDVGDRVGKGQTLIVLEAMKMELPVRATADGTVEAINCREGDLVQPGASLIEMEETD